MGERKTLSEGLDTIEATEKAVEEQFVYGKKTKSVKPATPLPSAVSEPQPEPVVTSSASEAEKSHPTPLTGISRVPVGARIRTELATALKRASLERQLQGIEPNSLQDILEEAIEPWLRKHGYLK
jgi:hypothetical protein